MDKIELGKKTENQVTFELEASNIITGRTFVASITRWGKSWLARKIIESVFGIGGIIIVDVEGEYVSLREKYPLLIIGRDIPLQLETAEFMADKILEAKVSVIIDLSTTEEELGKEYVDKLLKRFFFLQTTARTPYLIVVEEAEDFIPEKGIATATCLDVFRNIAKKGGKRGIGIMIIAHRPAWVSKGVLSQCANKAIGRMDWPSDLAVIEEYLRIPHKTIDRLPTLGKGEFFFAGDWVEKPVFVKVGPVKTTHLGYTPNVIPPSPKELQAVIGSLQKALPEIIEKIKPTVVPIDEIKSRLKTELENKYKDRIESIQRTAEEKAERKFKTRIDELQEHVEKLSRSQALQPVSPISDVLEHPIVRTRMLELSDKARDLLTRIEREPGLTREQLAAFLTTSTNSIANTVDSINRIFRATAIIGEGKPLKYRSMLKRLFITDVGKREIEEMQRLQNELQDKKQIADTLQPQVIQLRRENSDISLELRKTKALAQEVQSRLNSANSETEKLKNQVKDLEVTAKAGQAINTAINQILDHRLQEIQPSNPSITTLQKPSIDEQTVNELLDKRLATLPTPDLGNISTSVSLDHKVTHFDFQKQEEHLKVDTTTPQGRIIFLITKGWFDQRHNRNEVVTELSNNGWSHDKNEVDSVLLELCQKGIFYRKISTGNVFWYSLQAEAKNLIHSLNQTYAK